MPVSPVSNTVTFCRTALAANAECDVYLATNSYLTTWFLRIPAVPVVYDMVAFDGTSIEVLDTWVAGAGATNRNEGIDT